MKSCPPTWDLSFKRLYLSLQPAPLGVVHYFPLKAPFPSDLTLATELVGSGLPKGPVFIVQLSFLLGLSFQVKLSNLFILLCNVF